MARRRRRRWTTGQAPCRPPPRRSPSSAVLWLKFGAVSARWRFVEIAFRQFARCWKLGFINEFCIVTNKLPTRLNCDFFWLTAQWRNYILEVFPCSLFCSKVCCKALRLKGELSFLAVQDSSIGDIVSQSVSQTDFWFEQSRAEQGRHYSDTTVTLQWH